MGVLFIVSFMVRDFIICYLAVMVQCLLQIKLVLRFLL